MGEKYLMLSELNIEGQFLGFSGKKKKKPKHLYLGIPSANLKIKIPKDLRSKIVTYLLPGEQINVAGISQFDLRKNKIKLTAYNIQPIGFCPVYYQAETTMATTTAKIKVCQKSGCTKKRSQSLLSELEKTLCDRGLRHKVHIEHTGCQKSCGNPSNCVVIVGDQQYKKVHPQAIPSLLETHWGDVDWH